MSTVLPPRQVWSAIRAKSGTDLNKNVNADSHKNKQGNMNGNQKPNFKYLFRFMRTINSFLRMKYPKYSDCEKS